MITLITKIALLLALVEAAWIPRTALTGWKAQPRDGIVARQGWHLDVRGGSTEESPVHETNDESGDQSSEENVEEKEEDSERYSRQVYTLGARAHGLIRASTIYLDGPPSSGLLYECAKNLALSGVRHLVVVRCTNDDDDGPYHNAALDDLGRAYQRAARAEIAENDPSNSQNLSDEQLLVEYLKRLNPNILVSTIDRSVLGEDTDDTAKRRVLLCVDRPSSTQLTLNEVSREHRLAFISVETAGVFGRIFCDFGSTFLVHDADGEMSLVTPLDRLEERKTEGDAKDGDDDTIVVHTVAGEKHDVSKGDEIEFQLRNGDVSPQRCIVCEVQTPFRFVVTLKTSDEQGTLDDFVSNMNDEAASFRRVKVPQEITFQSLSESLISAQNDPSLFAACDLEKSFDTVRRDTSMACFEASASFVQAHGRLPTLSDETEFRELANEKWDSLNGDTEGGDHCKTFLKGCAAKFSPFQAVFGAIGAQEALKAATSLYFPVRQFLVYDVDEVLEESESLSHDDIADDGTGTSQAPGLRYILGDDTVNALQRNKIFVVGAGAIGCEILKNLAAMGCGTLKKGKIILTDMDTIEKSNLSRQLLFRDSDIGSFKSTAAQKSASRFNPDMKIVSHSSKVGGEGHSPFNEKFWSKKVDTVLNALDNVEARLYMDDQCVANQKALVDAGTMGPKGNVQVVVPHQSESYASSVDPPEPAIPVCTLKNFPYAISHTIQWGRDMFDGLFEKRPQQANDFIDRMQSKGPDEMATQLLHEKGEDSAVESAVNIAEDLKDNTLETAESIQNTSLKWAAKLAYDLFFKASRDLIEEHPLDSKDEDGEPFWSGTRRPPKALLLDVEPVDSEQDLVNKSLLDFVKGAARLRWETLSGISCTDADSVFTDEHATEALQKQYGTTLVETPQTAALDAEVSTKESAQVIIHEKLQEAASSSVPAKRMTPLEFEKDDESNGHVAFVTAASNLRAICYGIPPVDKMETRRVAGNIVPAMITTTAFVSALSCIELVKLVKHKPFCLHDATSCGRSRQHWRQGLHSLGPTCCQGEEETCGCWRNFDEVLHPASEEIDFR